MKELKITNRVLKSNGIHQRSRFEQKSDSEVWDYFRNGDKDALIFIYQDYHQKLFRYAHQFINDRELIKDCIQELFVDLFQKRSRLGPTTSIKFYLFRSLRRLIAKQIKNIPEQGHSVESGQLLQVSFSNSMERQLIEQEEEEETTKRIKNAIAKLTPNQQEAIYYFFFENTSYKELAEIMELKKIKSARTLIYRAIERIKKEIEADSPRGAIYTNIKIIALLNLAYHTLLI